MSADNWTTCPRCANRRVQALLKQAEEVSAAYGKVGPTEYERLRAEFDRAATKRLEPTFREDYEIGVSGEDFSVNYGGSCEVCGLSHKFKVTQSVKEIKA